MNLSKRLTTKAYCGITVSVFLGITFAHIGEAVMLGIGKKRFDQPVTSVLGLMAAAALVLTMQSQAEASDFDGRIRGLRLNVGTSVARVSIFVGPHNSPCAAAEWYAFENAHRDIGALWASYLNSALAASRTVFINGTGQCDTSGVEGVGFIEFRAVP